MVWVPVTSMRGVPRWTVDPFAFWTANGGSLVRKVMEVSDQRGSIPQVVGRDKTVYEALYDAAELQHLKSIRG
ncbi:hypothetical protein BH11ARM2_BH11ARM2_27750 [soil metagenome]